MNAVDQVVPGFDDGGISEIEQALLGAIFTRNEALHKIRVKLTPEHFLYAVHGRIFEHCKRLIERRATVTPALLLPYFDADDGLAEVGGAQYLNRIMAAAVTVQGAPDYAEAIHEAYLRRQLLEIAEDIAHAASGADIGTQALGAIEDAEQALFKLATRGGGEQTTVKAEGSFDHALADLDEMIALDGELPGITTGIRELDYALGGWRRARLAIIAGRPAMGKSALAISAAEAAAVTRPTLYFSGEMPHEELMQRIIAAHVGVSYEDIGRGTVTPAQREAIAQARPAIANLNLEVTPLVNMTASDVAARARRFKRQHGDECIVFADHLGHIKAENPRANRVHQIEEITGTLKALALDADIPVVVLSQLNRAVEQRDDKRPAMADLRNSGSIEQDADQIIFVYREAYYFAQSPPSDEMKRYEWEADLHRLEGQMDLLIRKNRGGRSPRDLEIACDLPTNRIGGRAEAQQEEI